MNITELARRLKIPTTELKAKLPELGFDIGMKAIKVDDRLAGQIIDKWKTEHKRQTLEDKVMAEKEKQQQEGEKNAVAGDRIVRLPQVISVRDLAVKFGLPVPALIAELMRQGVMSSISDKVDYDIAAIVAEGLGIKTEWGEDDSQEQKRSEELHQDILLSKGANKAATDIRPPIVVVMGHVDHGKTKLLDTIRDTKVMEGESGGITQHIGAYQVEKKNRKITFIDTPGHEAFSQMRSRGAVVADVAILVVAADDGVQPQTIEAIKMIQDAQIPMVVAINKIDKPEANPDKVRKGLSELNILVEGWGGDVPSVEISAKQAINLDELLDMVLLLADLNKESLQTRNFGPAIGVIIESHVDKGAGPVATVMIHAGELKIGDSFQIGKVFGKIKALRDFTGKLITVAGPSTPVQIVGLSSVPEAGMILTGGVDLKKLRRLLGKQKQVSAKNLLKQDKSAEDQRRSFNLVLKADVVGSLEAIENSLRQINSREVKVNIISRGLGNITEIDVIRAADAQAKLYGFNVEPTTKAREFAQDKEVKIETFTIIYALLDNVKQAVEDSLEPEIIRQELGKLEILKNFGKREGNLVVGGKVVSGIFRDNAKFIVYRGAKVMGEGVISEIRIGPDKRSEVQKGDQCGLKVSSSAELLPGDIIEVYSEEIKKRTLN